MTELNRLKENTLQLGTALDQLKMQFDELESAVSLNDREQFAKMKRETTAIYELLEAWETHALKLIKEGRVNIVPQQIIKTKENFELIIPHSYYKDIRKRRFVEYIRSCHYVLNLILTDIEKRME